MMDRDATLPRGDQPIRRRRHRVLALAALVIGATSLSAQRSNPRPPGRGSSPDVRSLPSERESTEPWINEVDYKGGTCVTKNSGLTLRGRYLDNTPKGVTLSLGSNRLDVPLRIVEWSNDHIDVIIPNDSQLVEGRSYAPRMSFPSGRLLRFNDQQVRICPLPLPDMQRVRVSYFTTETHGHLTVFGAHFGEVQGNRTLYLQTGGRERALAVRRWGPSRIDADIPLAGGRPRVGRHRLVMRSPDSFSAQSNLLAFDYNFAPFADALYAKFSHDRCVTCHAFRGDNRATGVFHRQDGRAEQRCTECHRNVPTWNAPSTYMDFAGLNAEELCRLVISNVAERQGLGRPDMRALLKRHLLEDERVRWAITDGRVPKRDGSRIVPGEWLRAPVVPGGWDEWERDVVNWIDAGDSTGPVLLMCR